MTPQVALLADGRRLHLQHGPIDLVIEAFGERDEIGAAYRQARERFGTILPELVEELGRLRQPLRAPPWEPSGAVARRMVEAVWPHRAVFVTPMAAVAGAVADEILEALVAGRRIEKAYVNNSGDIAVHLATGAELRLGIVGELFRPSIDGTARLGSDQPARGVATSGWRGRSMSFGIADAVTVLAPTTAAADVAATLIANTVDADHPSIVRVPANELDDDTDLGARLVTDNVGRLDRETIDAALGAGCETAERMLAQGLIVASALMLQGQTRAVGGTAAALAGFGDIEDG